MPPHDDHFPFEYLRSASVQSLESYELSRLSHAANLRKEIVALVNEWLDETAGAMLARWLLEHWAQVHGAVGSPEEAVAVEQPPGPKKAVTLPAPRSREFAAG